MSGQSNGSRWRWVFLTAALACLGVSLSQIASDNNDFGAAFAIMGVGLSTMAATGGRCGGKKSCASSPKNEAKARREEEESLFLTNP